MAFRTAVLSIDRSTVLPLMYEYDEGEGCYRSVGFVRVGSAMVPEVRHDGPDRVSIRDEFLRKVLVAVAVPEPRAREIVAGAEHDPDRPTPPG